MPFWFQVGLRAVLAALLIATGMACGGSGAGKTNVPAGGGGADGADPFVLSWQDDFDTLSAAWQLQTFTFGGNLAQFSTENASVANGVLTMKLTPNPASATDFHQYDIEWTPAGVKYFMDGTLLRTWTAHVDLLNLPQTILVTIWASSAASWAGPITPTSAPTSADVDWIRVYDWNG